MEDDVTPMPEDLDFKGITSRYADIEGVVIDPAKVPDQLRHLIPLAKHWSIGDDVERANMMWLTPYEELKAMVFAVGPFRDDIWKWCSSHHKDTPVPDEVIVFDALGQAAAEAEALYLQMDD
jgi:hypothetical protein